MYWLMLKNQNVYTYVIVTVVQYYVTLRQKFFFVVIAFGKTSWFEIFSARENSPRYDTLEIQANPPNQSHFLFLVTKCVVLVVGGADGCLPPRDSKDNAQRRGTVNCNSSISYAGQLNGASFQQWKQSNVTYRQMVTRHTLFEMCPYVLLGLECDN